ncbi:MAG: bifunctional DNA-formamidopyrimidine glycosylase/DNA-(apurinic or apyrimidinic site) lyase [Chromatiales bacterium]|jgi:formamidopyrimidine-DNA glycosylase|nr:bifunctional DNA-formamidopyrimidine glycosylase/DNA-(apurinic or apyrimidinic site) lyase [Chromatiales bacterium]
MPELPEVETTCRGIMPHVCERRVTAVRVRERRLRQPISSALESDFTGQVVDDVVRRGKYLLLRSAAGTLIMHLGMSGSLRVLGADAPAPGVHDHLDLVFDDEVIVRLRDPRRFGLALWTREDPYSHVLLAKLGPEPLEEGFNGAHLYALSCGRRSAVKTFIMDAHVVVGVGNIYASEALFQAGIHPQRAAGRISMARYERLAQQIQIVLREAIRQGGTTLRDFSGGDGRPGYFAQRLAVYGREGEPCLSCGAPIRSIRQAQRSSYFCSSCQS